MQRVISQQHSRRKIESLKTFRAHKQCEKKIVVSNSMCASCINVRPHLSRNSSRTTVRKAWKTIFIHDISRWKKSKQQSAGRSPRRSNGNFPFHFFRASTYRNFNATRDSASSRWPTKSARWKQTFSNFSPTRRFSTRRKKTFCSGQSRWTTIIYCLLTNRNDSSKFIYPPF